MSAPPENRRPPQGPLRFLRWFCADRFMEEIEGDLYEWYAEMEEAYGSRRANTFFYINLFTYLRSYFFRKRNLLPKISLDMYKNYLTIAIRYFFRKKTHSLINIFGLAVGVAACLLIMQYVSFELSFDQFHSNGENIYRVVNHRFQNNKLIQKGTITYPTVGPAMYKDFPEVQSYTRLFPLGRNLARLEPNVYEIENSYYADTNFLPLFTFPLIVGNPKTALQNEYSVVLSQSEADRLFGSRESGYGELLGQTLFLDQHERPYEITGVCRDVPSNSLLQFDMLVSYQTFINRTDKQADISWTWSDFHHFLELDPDADPDALEAKFPAFSDRYFKGDEVSGSEEVFFLQPLKDAHLYSDLEYEIGRTSNGRLVWALLIVAGLILVIAWLNYINLSTARAMERAKEVGVRKVLGSTKGQLIQQFFTESALLNLLGLILAVFLIELSLPLFRSILDVDLSWKLLLGQGFGGAKLPLMLIGLFLLGVFISGAYPALVLSKTKIASILKGRFHSNRQNIISGKSLVIFQFTISMVFIAGTILVYQQIQFMRHKNLGINIDHTLVVRGPELTPWDSTFILRVNSFKEELERHPGVKGVTTSYRLPGDRLGRLFDLSREGMDEGQNRTASFMGVDYEWLEQYAAKLLSGRHFRSGDHHVEWEKLDKILLNQSAVELLDFASPETALNQKVRFWDRTWEVVGVVDNFHQESLRVPIEPIIFFPAYGTNNYLSIKIDPEKTESVLALAENAYGKTFPGNAFRHFYLDERYDRQYMADYSFGKILAFFTFLAIAVACLGLFGLISYASLLRAKELGVRKILGASPTNLFVLLTKDFAILIGIAFVIAIPVALFSMRRWLENFAYHVDIQWWVFVLAGLATILIALISVGYQSAKAALENPVEALKYE